MYFLQAILELSSFLHVSEVHYDWFLLWTLFENRCSNWLSRRNCVRNFLILFLLIERVQLNFVSVVLNVLETLLFLDHRCLLLLLILILTRFNTWWIFNFFALHSIARKPLVRPTRRWCFLLRSIRSFITFCLLLLWRLFFLSFCSLNRLNFWHSLWCLWHFRVFILGWTCGSSSFGEG